MARVTVEDCMKVVCNRFELVVVGSQRAKDIASGSPLTIDRDNDKNPVIALREIAQHTVNPELLNENIIRNLQKRGSYEENEEELLETADEDNMSALDMEMIEDASSLNIESDSEDDFSFNDDNLEIED